MLQGRYKEAEQILAKVDKELLKLWQMTDGADATPEDKAIAIRCLEAQVLTKQARGWMKMMKLGKVVWRPISELPPGKEKPRTKSFKWFAQINGQVFYKNKKVVSFISGPVWADLTPRKDQTMEEVVKRAYLEYFVGAET